MSRLFVEHEALRHQWYVVAESVDVTDAPLAVRLLGADYVVWRTGGGELVAAPDRCPHRESPLSIGTVENGCLSCPYHGWTFGDGGRCVAIPSSGKHGRIPPAAHLGVARVEERYGLVWICPDEPVGNIPAMPAEDDPAYRRINSGVETWATSATRMTDNFMDFAHFPWVHTSTFGIQTATEVPTLHIEELADGYVGYRYEVDARNDTGGTIASDQEGAIVHRRMTTGFHLPFTVRSTIHYDTGLDHLLLLCTTPVDDTTSYFTFVVWRNDDFSTPGEEIIAFDRAIGAEDKVMLERIPGVLPLDQQATVSVQSDKPSVEWRRRLAALLGS